MVAVHLETFEQPDPPDLSTVSNRLTHAKKIIEDLKNKIEDEATFKLHRGIVLVAVMLDARGVFRDYDSGSLATDPIRKLDELVMSWFFASENNKGHAISRHYGKSIDELIARPPQQREVFNRQTKQMEKKLVYDIPNSSFKDSKEVKKLLKAFVCSDMFVDQFQYHIENKLSPIEFTNKRGFLLTAENINLKERISGAFIRKNKDGSQVVINEPDYSFETFQVIVNVSDVKNKCYIYTAHPYPLDIN